MPPANDDFANATSISGASGTSHADLDGATVETNEPVAWYGAGADPVATAWWSWTCPADGRYFFRVTGALTPGYPLCDLAVYTGITLAGLTPVARNEGGGHFDLDINGFDYDNPVSKLGFQAVEGVVYKIQVDAYYDYGGTVTEIDLVWESAGVQTGETQATAVTIPFPGGLLYSYFELYANEGGASLPGDYNSRLETGWYGGPSQNHYVRAKWFQLDLPSGFDGEMVISLIHGKWSLEWGLAFWEVYDGSLNPVNDIAANDAFGVVTTSGWRPNGGATNAPQTIAVTGGNTYYIVFATAWADWNDSGEGVDADGDQFEDWLTVDVTTVCLSTDPTVDACVENATVSVGGGAVSETQSLKPSTATSDYPSITDALCTFRVSGADLPPPGRYRVYFDIKDTGTATTFCVVRRNGFPLEAMDLLPVTSSYSVVEGTDVTHLVSYLAYYTGPGSIPVLADDVFEFCFFHYYGATGTISVREVCWAPVVFGGNSGPPITLLEPPDIPLGASDMDTLSDLFQDSKKKDYGSKDLCVTDNGDVYVIFVEKKTTGAPVDGLYTLKKWDGSSWSTVDTDPMAFNPFRLSELGSTWSFGASIDTDGEDVFVAYATSAGDGSSVGAFFNSKIHVRKYDVSGASWSELGTGIQPLAPSTFAALPGTFVSGVPNIKISPNGTPWVVFGANRPSESVNSNIDPYAYYWDGGAWVDAELPLPDDPHPTSPDTTINSTDLWYYAQVELTFCTSGGVGDDPTVVYIATYEGSGGSGLPVSEWYSHEYGGTPGTWTSKTFILSDIYPVVSEGDSGWWEWHQGMALINNGSSPILVAAVGHDGTPAGIMATKMDSSGNWQPFALTRPISGTPAEWLISVDADCDADGNIWVMYASFDFWEQAGVLIEKIDEDGSQDGSMWASRRNDGIGLWDNPTESVDRIVAFGNTMYALTTGFDRNGPGGFSDPQKIMLWEIPHDADPYIPWVSTVFLPHIYRYVVRSS